MNHRAQHRAPAILFVLLVAASCGDDRTDPVEQNGQPDADVGVVDMPGEPMDVSTSNDARTDVAAVDTRPPVDLGPLGGDRPAEVVTPMDWSSDRSYPVVVLLHGLSANSTLQNAYFRTSALVDEFQFVLVLPEGTENSSGSQFWNATNACCDFDSSGVDDSTYLSELAADAVFRYAGDPDRVYFMGHSNGGFMSFRMACDHSDQVAGVASLAGSTWQDPANCGDPAPVAVLQIHGTADPTVPFEGRPNIHPGANEIVERWADRNGCQTGPDFIGSADFDDMVSGAETDKERWTDCDDEMDVQLWTMRESGHIPSVDAAMTRDILEFLFSHSR